MNGAEREQQDSSQKSMSVLENCISILNSLYLFISFWGFFLFILGTKRCKRRVW